MDIQIEKSFHEGSSLSGNIPFRKVSEEADVIMRKAINGMVLVFSRRLKKVLKIRGHEYCNIAFQICYTCNNSPPFCMTLNYLIHSSEKIYEFWGSWWISELDNNFTLCYLDSCLQQ